MSLLRRGVQGVRSVPIESVRRPAAGSAAPPPREAEIAAAQAVTRKPSAVLSGEAIIRVIPTWQRVGAFILLALSFLGTIVAFHGGWAPILNLQFRPFAVLGGIGLQVWCLIFQLGNRHQKQSFWYIQAFILDVVPTFIGLLPIFSTIILSILGMVGLHTRLAILSIGNYTGLQIAIWVLSAVFAVAIALVPEDRLID